MEHVTAATAATATETSTTSAASNGAYRNNADDSQYYYTMDHINDGIMKPPQNTSTSSSSAPPHVCFGIPYCCNVRQAVIVINLITGALALFSLVNVLINYRMYSKFWNERDAVAAAAAASGAQDVNQDDFFETNHDSYNKHDITAWLMGEALYALGALTVASMAVYGAVRYNMYLVGASGLMYTGLSLAGFIVWIQQIAWSRDQDFPIEPIYYAFLFAVLVLVPAMIVYPHAVFAVQVYRGEVSEEATRNNRVERRQQQQQHTDDETHDHDDLVSSWNRRPDGHLFCGFCCDMRRAVMAVNSIWIVLGLLALIQCLMLYSYLQQNDNDDDVIYEVEMDNDDFVVELIMGYYGYNGNESADDMAKLYRRQAMFALCRVLVAALAIVGALRFNLYLVGLGIMYYTGLAVYHFILCVVYGMAFHAYIALVAVPILFAYPHVVLAWQIRQGIVSAETYVQDERCCGV